jgi:PAS domain S-box-containing protein
MKKPFRYFNPAMSLGSIILAAILFFTYLQGSYAKTAAAWLFRTQEVRLTIVQTLGTLVDNETNTKNFIITGQQEFLKFREKSNENTYKQIDTLRQLTYGNAVQQIRIDSLLFYVNNEIGFSDRVIDLRKEKGLQSAIQLISSGKWTFYMDGIRRVIEQMQYEEGLLQQQRKIATEKATDLLNKVIFTISVIIIICLIIIFILRDWSLTNRQKTIEEKLKETKKGFQLLVGSVKEYAIFLLDKEGRVASWNDGARRIKGFDEKEIIGKAIDIFYMPNDIQNGEPQKNLQKARLYGHFETEGFRVRKDGSFFYANIVLTALTDDQGRFNGYSKVTKDISEKRRAEDDLNNFNEELILSRKKIQESEISFRNVIEQTINPILILKGEDLKLEMANDPLFKLWNVGKESIGKPFLEILPEMKDQPFPKLLLDVLKNGSTHYGNEQPAHFIRVNGERETVYFNFVYLPYRENNKSISGVLVQATDVTVQVAARNKIETSETKLRIANKKLSFQNGEKEKRTAELLIANNQLTKTETELNNLNIELEQRVKERTGEVIKNEKLFRAVVENNYDIISLLNESLSIIYQSPSATRILGWSNEEINDFDVFNNIHADDREKAAGFIRESIANACKPINAIFRWLHKHGNYVSLEGTVTNLLHDENVKAFVFNFRDVTERIKANEKLLASEARYRRLFEAAKDGILILNSNTGIIEDVNPYLITMLGYSHAEFLGKELWEIGLFKDIFENKSAFEKLKKEGYSRYDNLPLQTKTHATFWVEFVSNIYDVNGRQVVQCNIRDISERKKAEQVILNLNTELEERVMRRTEQLKKTNEELESFSYSISHDLRAPLRAIIGFTSILEEDYCSKLDEEATRLTAVIKNNTLKMSNLIDDLLAFSRIGRHSVVKTTIDINDMVQEIIAEMEKKNENRKIDWVVHSLSKVKGDVNAIRQVWINLISNAIKYSGNAANQRIEIQSCVEKDQIVYSIKDNGVGFDQKYVNKLFKVFQRLHANAEFEGTGVGLAIVEKIISKHSGKVWAEGKLNVGASFYFSLPAES